MTADVGKTDAPVTGDGEPTPHLWVPSDGGVSPSEAAILERHSGLSRRTMLKVGAVGAAGAAIVAGKAFVEPALAPKGLLSSNGEFAAAAADLTVGIHVLEEAPRARRRPAELDGQRAAPDLAEPARLPGPDRLQNRREGRHPLLHHLQGAADRQERQARGVVRRRRQARDRRYHS